MGKVKTKPHRGVVKRKYTDSSSEDQLSSYIPENFLYTNEEKVIFAIVLLMSAVIYIYTMYPGLPGGDSGELMATAKDFGVSHPPGYPTFTTMAALIINLFPFGSTAWKTNLLSAVIGACANAMMYVNVKRFSSSDAAGLLTAGWCGFSRIFWMWSIQGEVFSFSNLFVTLIMYIAWRFANAEGKSGKLYEAKLGALVCGLALTNQHTSVLYIAPCGVWVMFVLYQYDVGNFESLFKVGLYGLAGLSPYLQLPISSFFFKARVSWGDHRLFSDFKKHLLREDFGTFRLVSSSEQSTLVDNFMVYFNDSSNELGVLTWVIFAVSIIAGIVAGTKKQRDTMLIYTAMFATYHLVFSSLANIKNPSGIFHGVLERFWLQPSIALTTMAGCGIGMCISFVKTKLGCPGILKYVFITLAVLAVSFQIQRNYVGCNENDNYYFWHYSRHILPHLPKGSILLTSGDFSTNTFRYHTIGEEYRTDVMVMDMQFMQAYWFYICLMPINWPDVSFPGLYKPGKQSKYPFYNLKMFLDENYDKYPVYMCVSVPEAEDSIQGYYEAWPFGMCKKFVRLADNPDPFEHLDIVPKWNLDKSPIPDPDRYETQTWEYTLLMSVLDTFTKNAIFLWNEANKLKGNPELQYKYYKKAFDILYENRQDLHARIDRGELTKNMIYYISPLEKHIGHVSLIMYSVEKDVQVKKEWEAKVKVYWGNYVQWHRDNILAKDAMWSTIQTILASKDFSNLRLQ